METFEPKFDPKGPPRSRKARAASNWQRRIHQYLNSKHGHSQGSSIYNAQQRNLIPHVNTKQNPIGYFDK